ncbi:MAG: hypothetical protein AAGA84_02400 [Pseudomonadota bacterium]
MIGWVILAGITGTLAMIAIHYLTLGSAKTVEVASLDLVQLQTRPRFTLQTIREPGLLSVRLLLLLAVCWLTIGELGRDAGSQADWPSILVVPGTDRGSIPQAVIASAHWLDDALTPLAESPVSDFSIGMLQRLDQSIPMNAALTIYGVVTEADWPARSPVFRRNLNWKSVADYADLTADPISTDQRLVIQLKTPQVMPRMSRVVQIWQDAGIADKVVLLGADAVAPKSPSTSVLQIGDHDADRLAIELLAADGRVVRAEDVEKALTDTQLATAIWRFYIADANWHAALRAPLGVNATQVQSFVVNPPVARTGMSSTPALWFVVIALLFVAERLLSMRSGGRLDA